MKQNKFPFQPFSKRVIIFLAFLYSLGYRSPTTDTTQTQIFSTDVRIVQFQGLLAHEAPRLVQQV